MENLDNRKLEVTKRYLQIKEKVNSLTKTQADFFSLMMVFAIAVIPVALLLEMYLILSLLVVDILPAAVIGISQLQKNNLKKDCCGDSMTLKEFDEFLNSEEYELYLKEVLEEKEKSYVESINTKKSNDEVIKISDDIVVKTRNEVNKSKNTTKR